MFNGASEKELHLLFSLEKGRRANVRIWKYTTGNCMSNGKKGVREGHSGGCILDCECLRRGKLMLCMLYCIDLKIT